MHRALKAASWDIQVEQRGARPPRSEGTWAGAGAASCPSWRNPAYSAKLKSFGTGISQAQLRQWWG